MARGQLKWPLPALAASLVLLAAGGWWYASRSGTAAADVGQAPARPEIQVIRVASWRLSPSVRHSGIDLAAATRTIRDARFDLLAIQQPEDGVEVLEVERLLSALGPAWRSGGVSAVNGGERLAILYRGDRLQQIGSASVLDLRDASDFACPPYTARFRANRFDFQLMVVQLNSADAERCRLETRNLANYVQDIASRQNEKDIIVLGDFGVQKPRSTLSLLADAGWQTTISEPTALSSGDACDNILIDPKHTTQWQGGSVVRFEDLYFLKDIRSASAAVSDHRPVYADFSAGGPDSD